MNYLAHLYFSAPTPLAWAGSLMGDFVKGPVPEDFPDELRKHLHLHRWLDTYTRQSPAFQNSRSRLDPVYRHARGVLVDVFYDHFLARYWKDYSVQPLGVFAQDVYRGLQSCYDQLSPALQQQLPHMIEHDWLTSYQRPDVVQRVLLRLEERVGGRFSLAAGFVELERHGLLLEKDFYQFMQEVSPRIRSWKLELGIAC